MWAASRQELPDASGTRFHLTHHSRPATYADVIQAWQIDIQFRSQFNCLLAESLYPAFRWETPAVTRNSLGKPFEFVLLDAPALARTPEPEAFAEHYSNAKNGIAVFPNLGGDAIMVVPCPMAEETAYGHLAAFVRLAPESQQHALWQSVGLAMENRLGKTPVWLSTAGAGVSWLHVRLDSRPKYYGFGPYKQMLSE